MSVWGFLDPVRTTVEDLIARLNQKLPLIEQRGETLPVGSQGAPGGSDRLTQPDTNQLVMTNITDGDLLTRTGLTITGTDPDDFADAVHVHAAADITSGTMATARLGSGTADSTTFLRGDQTYALPTGGAGGITTVATTVARDALSPAENDVVRNEETGRLEVYDSAWAALTSPVTRVVNVLEYGAIASDPSGATPGYDSGPGIEAATLACIEYVLEAKATAATSTTVTLAGQTWTTDQYALTGLSQDGTTERQHEVAVIRGTGKGQYRVITANNTTGQVTIETAWTTTPDTTSYCRIMQSARLYGRVWDRALYVPPGLYRFNGEWKAIRGSESPVVVGGGFGVTTFEFVDGMTETTLTSFTSTTVTKTGAGWATNQWIDSTYTLYLWDAAYVRQSHAITSNTGTVLTVAGPITGTPTHFAIGKRSALYLNGTTKGQLSGFSIRSSAGTGSCYTYLLYLDWKRCGDFGAHPDRVNRTSNENVFRDIACEGPFVGAAVQIGPEGAPGNNNQVDSTRWYTLRVSGAYNVPAGVKRLYSCGINVGGGNYGNNLIHKFYDPLAVQCQIGLSVNYSDVWAFGCTFQSNHTDIYFNGISAAARFFGNRSEGSGYMFRSNSTVSTPSYALLDGWDWHLGNDTTDIDNLGYIGHWFFPGEIEIRGLKLTNPIFAGKHSAIKLRIQGNAGRFANVVLAGAKIPEIEPWNFIEDGNLTIAQISGYSRADVGGTSSDVDYGPMTLTSSLAYSGRGHAYGQLGERPGSRIVNGATMGHGFLTGTLEHYGGNVRVRALATPGAPAATVPAGPFTYTETVGGSTTVVTQAAATLPTLSTSADVKCITGHASNVGLRRAISSNTVSAITTAAWPAAWSIGDTFQVVRDYTYYVVYVDGRGNETVPSSGTVITGPGWLHTSGNVEYMNIAPNASDTLDGVVAIRILKNATNAVMQDLTTAASTTFAVEAFPVQDSGLSTSAYTAKTSNETGGQFAVDRYDAGDTSTAITIDWNDGNVQKVRLTGNCTFTFSNPIAGAEYYLECAQDGTGSRLATWPGTVTWPGGVAPTLTTTLNKVDVFRFVYNGTNYRGSTEGLNYT